MTAKITASTDGIKVTIGTAAEDALQIDSVAKTIAALAPYSIPDLNLAKLLSDPGYIKLPGGLILQWGQGSTPDGGAATVTFPIPFPNDILGSVACARTSIGASGIGICAVTGRSKSSISVGLITSAGAWFSSGFFWIAIGH